MHLVRERENTETPAGRAPDAPVLSACWRGPDLCGLSAMAWAKLSAVLPLGGGLNAARPVGLLGH